MFSQPVGGIRIHMHFMLSVHYTALRGDVFAFVRRYLRPRLQISSSVPADISARGLTGSKNSLA